MYRTRRKTRRRRTVRRKKGGSKVEITRYYMDGCPACEMSKPAWDAFKRTTNVKFTEIESANIPENAKIDAFPTYIVRKNGKETKRQQGAIMDAATISQLL